MGSNGAQASAGKTAPKKPVPTAPSRMQTWFPAGVWIRQYKWGQYTVADLVAAISVAALLIPESMGYASVAGVPAQVGLYCAPLALIGYALFGGSRLLVFAAAGSVAAVSASIVGNISGGDQKAAVGLTAALALTTGVVFLIAGFARMGWVSNFMSKAVIAGLIIGMAIQIIIGQTGKLVGVDIGDGNSFSKVWSMVSQFSDWNLAATAIGFGSVLLIFAMQRFMPKLPAALTAVVLASVIIAVADPDVDLVATIPTGLPTFGIPSGISASDWATLMLGGVLVALVGFSEGWGASANIAKKTHDDLETNQEFRAYGVGSLGAGFLGGMPVTGSLSKSSTAMTAGAKTQMSNVFLALFVLLTLLFLAPLFQWLPEATLAAVVITAMWGSANPKKLVTLWHVDRVDFWFAMVTTLVVLYFDLLPAMIAGIVVSVFYLIYRVSFPGSAVLGQVQATGDFDTVTWKAGHREGEGDSNAHEVPGVLVYRFSAPLIFSNAEEFKSQVTTLLIKAGTDGEVPGLVVIDCEAIPYCDTTGSDALASTFQYTQRYGIEFALARLHIGARKLLTMTGALDEIGEERVFDTVRNAVDSRAPA